MRAFAIRHPFQGEESSGVIVGAESAGNGTPLNVSGLARLGIHTVGYRQIRDAYRSGALKV